MAHRFVLTLALLAPALAGGSAPPPASPPTAPTQTSPPAATTSRPAPKPTPKPVVAPVLEGTVKGPDAKPIEGALVSASPVVGRWNEPARTTRTDAAGHFKLELSSGDLLSVRIEARGLAPVRLEKVRPGQSLVVTLARGRAIEGVVHDVAGQPVAGARVAARSDQGLMVSPWEAEASVVRATTDSRGRFRLDGVGPGLHSVSARARGYGEATRRNVRPGGTVTLALRPGGWFTGHVVDQGGAPVKSALVRAELEPRFWETSRTEATDGDGRFELDGLSAGRYTVVVNARGYALGIETGVTLPADGAAEIAISLASGVSVKGRLVDAAERPLHGRARMQELARQELPTAATEVLSGAAGDDGRFRIDHVPPGAWTLAATAPGFAGQRVELEVGGRDPLVDAGDVVLERGLAIQGRVRTAAGAPVPGASIGAYDDEANEAAARSDDDGSFVLAGLRPNPYELEVRATGFATLRKQLSPGPEPVDLVLSPGGAIAGLVVEEGDRPVDSYRVAARADSANRRREETARSVASSDGRFLLEDVAEGSYVLQVLAPERSPGSASGIKVAAGRTTDVGTIRLGRGGIVRGTVVDSGGGGVAGATVKAVGPGDGRQRWMDLNSTVTDAAGGFEVLGVAPGNATVGASHPQYAPAETSVVVEPAKGPSEVRLTLSQGGRIEGLVRRREGTPLAGLTISIFSPTRRAFTSGIASNVMTGTDGSFVLEHVPPGNVVVEVMAEAGPSAMVGTLSRSVDVREGETSRVELVQREIVVSGHTSRSGAPLPGVRLELTGQDSSTMHFAGGGGGVPAAGGLQHQRAVSADDGSYALIVDEPGRFEVMAASADGRTRYPGRFVEIPDADQYDLELDFAGAKVSGVVVDKETDKPVEGASVGASPKAPREDGFAGGPAGPDGRFELVLDPGDYRVAARAEQYAEGRVEVSVGPEGVTDLRIALEKGLEIAGRVVDAAGRGLGDLVVLATSTERATAARTLADGAFRFGGLTDGAFALVAGSPEAGFAVKAPVRPGAKDLRLTLRPAGRLQILVRGPDETPLAKVYPRVIAIDGVRVRVPVYGQGGTDTSGLALLPVPPGNLEIELRGETYRGSLRVSVAEGATVPVEMTLTERAEAPR